MISWKEVVADHSTQAGVSIKNKKVNSILISNNMYDNSFKNNKIKYLFKNIGAGKYWHKTFKIALKDKTPITVYKKEKVNVWNDMGKYFTSSVTEEKDQIIIILEKK